jgi:hypothetical protein
MWSRASRPFVSQPKKIMRSKTPKPNPVRRQALMAAVDGLDVDLVEGQIT